MWLFSDTVFIKDQGCGENRKIHLSSVSVASGSSPICFGTTVCNSSSLFRSESDLLNPKLCFDHIDYNGESKNGYIFLHKWVKFVGKEWIKTAKFEAESKRVWSSNFWLLFFLKNRNVFIFCQNRPPLLRG